MTGGLPMAAKMLRTEIKLFLQDNKDVYGGQELDDGLAMYFNLLKDHLNPSANMTTEQASQLAVAIVHRIWSVIGREAESFTFIETITIATFINGCKVD